MAQTPERITPRDEDYGRWYLDVIRQAGLAEAAEVVKGCMVIRPHGFAIWERMQAQLDAMFKATGHQNVSFPLLIPQSFIAREAEHVEGFSPELAVVTHAGGHALEEPYVIRPTSETIIGHFFGRWIESYRDLPLLLNQWCNVMRWEKRTRLFLRTSEFLWQEGHTAHASHQEAAAEVRQMLDIYARFAREWMAMPVVRGVKTASEKFAGALESHCIEALMQDGRALQAGTSHDLGQNFGRAFDVTFQNKQGEQEFVWQTSWGASTRLIGALIMTHSDDRGLVLPPRLAPVQAVVIPILARGADPQALVAAARRLTADLKQAGVAAHLDDRDYKPGYKYFEWEQKGVPLRLELGPRDLDRGEAQVRVRTQESRHAVPLAGAAEVVLRLLEELQAGLLAAAEARLAAGTVALDSWQDFATTFADHKSRFVMAHWDGDAATEAKIKEQTRATIRCVPHGPAGEPGRCILTGRPSSRRVLFARAY